jgi:hypothetical protein
MTSETGGGQPQAAVVTAERAPALARERGTSSALFVLVAVSPQGGTMARTVLVRLGEAGASEEER